MFRKSTAGLIILLSTVGAGAALAQSAAQPSPKAHASQDTVSHKAHAAAKPAAKPAAKAAAKPAWTKDQIKAAQVGLTKAGLYKGDTSGVMNSATRKALREYQKQNHMPATGHLSDSLLAKLQAS